MICDTNSTPELSNVDEFYDLYEEIQSFTSRLSKPSPFYSSSRQFNRFENKMIQQEIFSYDFLMKYGKLQLVVEGSQNWAKLAIWTIIYPDQITPPYVLVYGDYPMYAPSN